MTEMNKARIRLLVGTVFLPLVFPIFPIPCGVATGGLEPTTLRTRLQLPTSVLNGDT